MWLALKLKEKRRLLGTGEGSELGTFAAQEFGQRAETMLPGVVRWLWVWAQAWVAKWVGGCLRWLWMWHRLGHRRIRQHFKLQRQIRGCACCARLTLPEETFYACRTCEDFDVCTTCHDYGKVVVTKTSQHQPHHCLSKEVLPLNIDAPQLSAPQCTAEAVAAAFETFADRPCLGQRVREGGEGAGFTEYLWQSYAEVYASALACGTGLQGLLAKDKRSFVGILGAVCVPWLVTDYGCTLKGAPVVLMHRATR
jgi:hypothetical protein